MPWMLLDSSRDQQAGIEKNVLSGHRRRRFPPQRASSPWTAKLQERRLEVARKWFELDLVRITGHV